MIRLHTSPLRGLAALILIGGWAALTGSHSPLASSPTSFRTSLGAMLNSQTPILCVGDDVEIYVFAQQVAETRSGQRIERPAPGRMAITASAGQVGTVGPQQAQTNPRVLGGGTAVFGYSSNRAGTESLTFTAGEGLQTTLQFEVRDCPYKVSLMYDAEVVGFGTRLIMTGTMPPTRLNTVAENSYAADGEFSFNLIYYPPGCRWSGSISTAPVTMVAELVSSNLVVTINYGQSAVQIVGVCPDGAGMGGTTADLSTGLGPTIISVPPEGGTVIVPHQIPTDSHSGVHSGKLYVTVTRDRPQR